MSATNSSTNTSSVVPTDYIPTPTLLNNPPAAASQPIWNTTTIIGAVFAILAVILGIPGAILAYKKLRNRKATRKNGKSPTTLSHCCSVTNTMQ
jgi:ABC-type Fe3+ transport system permease subunit